MPNFIEITDFSDPQLDLFARLTEGQLRNRREQDKGIFIAESPIVIENALRSGCEPLALLMERKHILGQGQDLISRCGSIPVYTADSTLLAELTGFSLTRGILCAMRRPSLPSLDALCAAARRIAVLDGIVDPTNVGAIFRSAAALGMDAVVLTPSCCDPLYRRAARVSMGAVFQIPWTRIGDAVSPSGLTQLRALGFQLAAMALRERSISIDDPQLMESNKLAIVLGNEGNGLSSEVIDFCDHTVCIPMSHGVNSLNVAAASAVAFWQLRVK